MSLLQSFIDIEPIASVHEIQKITKMSFIIPLTTVLWFVSAFNFSHQIRFKLYMFICFKYNLTV
jgi:hypothetical protein